MNDLIVFQVCQHFVIFSQHKHNQNIDFMLNIERLHSIQLKEEEFKNRCIERLLSYEIAEKEIVQSNQSVGYNAKISLFTEN